MQRGVCGCTVRRLFCIPQPKLMVAKVNITCYYEIADNLIAFDAGNFYRGLASLTLATSECIIALTNATVKRFVAFVYTLYGCTNFTR